MEKVGALEAAATAVKADDDGAEAADQNRRPVHSELLRHHLTARRTVSVGKTTAMLVISQNSQFNIGWLCCSEKGTSYFSIVGIITGQEEGLTLKLTNKSKGIVMQSNKTTIYYYNFHKCSISAEYSSLYHIILLSCGAESTHDSISYMSES